MRSVDLLVSHAPPSLTDSSDLETAGWPVTLSPCKWAALGPGGCPCGPAPCLVVLSADWLPGAWSVFMRCRQAAGDKTRRVADASRSRWFINPHCNTTFPYMFLRFLISVFVHFNFVKVRVNVRDAGRAKSSSAEEQSAMRSPGFACGRSNRAGQESGRGGS